MQPVDLTPGHETREVFWNTVNYQIPLDIFALISLAIFGYGLYKRYQLWMAVGKPELRKDNMGERIKTLFNNSGSSAVRLA